VGPTPSVRRWWREHFARYGFRASLAALATALWAFARESTPAQRRRRYGDVDFDWDYRVDTTSATVRWRDRLLGLLHSPYQPTDPALFHEMLGSLNIDFRQFVFVDLGSGKGRTLLMASDYPFRRIIGVELLPFLHAVAEQNISRYQPDVRRCSAVESICGDAREFVFPLEPVRLYLSNPLPEDALAQVVGNLEKSLLTTPRSVCVVYHNPVLEQVLRQSRLLKKTGGTHQYAVYANG